MKTLPEQLRIKAAMIDLGERIAYGSEAELMCMAADRIEALEARIAELQRVNSAFAAPYGADGIDDSMELKGGPWDTGALGRDPDHAVVAEGSREEVAEALNPFKGMWQDSEGKIPVTAEGQRVGRWESHGIALVQGNPTLRPEVRLIDGEAYAGPVGDEYMISWEKPE